MANGVILQTMRAQAWERAKGELAAMLVTFWGSDGAKEGPFDSLQSEVQSFITKVEDEGLHE